MASALTDKLSQLVKQISGQARITESNVTDMLREVRMALLEADVALPVVRDFMARVKEKALGQEVLSSLKPGQVLVSIVQKELAATMGQGVADLNLATQPPAVILMAGLQGAGKTTSTAKLARHLIDQHALAHHCRVDEQRVAQKQHHHQRGDKHHHARPFFLLE